MLDWKVSIPELVTNMQQALASSLPHSADCVFTKFTESYGSGGPVSYMVIIN